jgi:hypothetical protein
MTLLKDLIDIPDHVQKGDFVLRLTEGVIRADETLRDYVVTPELTGCFDNALSFIRSALQTTTSKATYLHGSFGSGKSHFMAVLHLILQGNTRARAIPELAPVISKHNEWILGKKFLLVPYHMIGAPDMESGILGGYVDFVRRTHPDAPIPGVYLAEGLFRDAENLRRQMGDAHFFSALNEGASTSSGWGELAEGWDGDRFDAAIVADPGSEARSQLISILISRFFGSYDTQAGGQGEAFLSLDKGLSVISKHAQSLGYDGLILFLDELVLWLASHAADLKFVHQEGQKLAKLVEAQTPDRPIPIISFVARQRDLSELIGDSVPGADRLNFGDALKHWEGRFHRITLEDRNLPAIAEKRLLKCKTATARQELDAAFEGQKFRDSVMNTLLTREGDRKMFRQVYPFSPALVQTLIAVSSVLQRERTALKVMMQLLVEQRDVLTIGDIVPVGDLFDVIAHGDEAFSPEMAIHFNNAKRLYHQKLLPLLEKQHEVRWEDLPNLPVNDAKRIAFRNDDRLIKTLLLSALVPAVESLRELNGDRLATLNYGTIKTPIQGREGSEVLRRCKTWAASVGEIRISEDANTTISIQLSGVDTEGILKQAEREDNRGNRARLVKQMLFAQFTIKGETEFEQYYDFVWRNTKRPCVVLFGNVRELSPASLEAIDERWKLVIDYPFDEPNRSPRDDLAKLQSFSESHPAGTKTLCWIPAFFSTDAEKELGTLVLLEHILAGDRFAQYANYLSPQDRQAAKSLLENQRSVLRQRISNHLDAAYGLEVGASHSLDTSWMLELHERFVSLRLGLELKPPVAANLKAAMEHLLDQALSHEFPAAPNFEVDVNRINNLEKVYQVVSEAARTTDGRALVDKTLRSLVRQIANPLRLGEMGQDATHFILGQDWKNHFIRKSSEVGGTISVKQLREWIDLPKPMGLPKEVQNLLILTYAEQTSRTFYRQTIPVDVSLKDLPNECELRDQKLPDEAQWQRAVQLTDHIFKYNLSSLLKPSNVTDLETKVKDKATAALPACQQYTQSLRDRLDQLNLAMDCDRLKTALATLTLLEQIVTHQAEEIVSILATAAITTTESAMADCLAKATVLHTVLEEASWDIFESIGTLADDRQTKAAAIHKSIEAALLSDEHVLPLSAELKTARLKAVRLLTQPIPQPLKPPPDPEPPPTDPGSTAKPLVIPPITTPTKAPVRQGAQENLDLAAAQALLVNLQQTLKKGDNIQVNISWIIAPKGTTQ